MLSRDENDLLTQTSSGTPMGDYMRRFWMPVMLSEELGEPDSAPVRVRLLGEDLIAFRDTEGRVGLVDRYCPHRRANLFFGRNEDCGIRCIYHGWKFDVDGNCVDLPSEPPESRFREKVRLTAYPTAIKGAVLWAYMGPAEKRGEVPDFGWMDLPESHIYRSRWIQQCNYAQAVEGEIDSAHVSFLHSLVDTNDTNNAALAGSYFSNDTAPKWKVIERDHGMILGARRVVENARYYWRMNQWYHPFYTMIAPVPGGPRAFRMWVPIDDENINIICVSFRMEQPVSAEEVKAWQTGQNSHADRVPGTLIPRRNRDNDYLVDREDQRLRTYSGIEGVRAQDMAMTEGAERIVDRTQEHLGTSDTAIIKMRRLLIDGAKALQCGVEPIAAQGSDIYRIQSHSDVIDGTEDFDAYPDIMEAMAVKPMARSATK
ncbi:MAG: hypothetical protein CMM69_02485 [Rhodospirillaceae bacterium]|nr:hypothetical protein [Rhodospirillaceae bacterium]OUX30375.1 MAG: hypothetical protein CBE16_02710 [Rhodospirillaceae bacterium TMED256]